MSSHLRTHTHTHSVGLYWMSDQPDAEISLPDNTHNRQTSMLPTGFEHAIPAMSGHRPTPQTARPLGSKRVALWSHLLRDDQLLVEIASHVTPRIDLETKLLSASISYLPARPLQIRMINCELFLIVITHPAVRSDIWKFILKVSFEKTCSVFA